MWYHSNRDTTVFFMLINDSELMKKIMAFSICCFFLHFAKAQTLELTNFATGFDAPVDIQHAGDDRLFIVERSGYIRIIDASGTTLATPFLDIDNVVFNADFNDERGLLGLAFHPDYANNGFLYVNYVSNSDETKIVRYTRNANDPNLADVGSAFELLSIDQPEWNHNGGCLRFGPDGYLYIGMGDGGAGGDPWNNSQNSGVLFGKLLRIDVNSGSPYSIPADNPFVGDPNTLDEIWALGMRNPWRFSFDKGTGDLWIGDVGQGDYEEIDFQAASSTGGENYGWRCYEGEHPYDLGGSSDCVGTYVDPVYEIVHNGFSGPCSITGGYVYRGTESPNLVGKYLCADFCTGEFFTVEPNSSGGFDGQEIAQFNYDISTFGQDVNGELYCAAFSDGRILKISFNECGSFASTVSVTSEPCEGESFGSATIDISGGTPPYTYTPNIDLNNLPPDDYNVTVTDANGCSSTFSFTINTLALPSVPTFTVASNTLTVDNTYSGYQWRLEGADIPGATNQTYVIEESGSYSVLVTGNNDCVNNSTETSVIFTSIAVIPSLSEFQISPSPFEKELLINIAVYKSTNMAIEIVDQGGKLIFQKELRVSGKHSEIINLETLPAGIYFTHLIATEGRVIRKIVKQ